MFRLILFVVQINTFGSLVLFSAVIHKRKEEKLVNKTIKYKLDRSSKMQFAIFYPKNILIFFLKIIDFVENLEMTQIAEVGGGGAGEGVIMTLCVRKSICDSPLRKQLA